MPNNSRRRQITHPVARVSPWKSNRAASTCPPQRIDHRGSSTGSSRQQRHRFSEEMGLESCRVNCGTTPLALSTCRQKRKRPLASSASGGDACRALSIAVKDRTSPNRRRGMGPGEKLESAACVCSVHFSTRSHPRRRRRPFSSHHVDEAAISTDQQQTTAVTCLTLPAGTSATIFNSAASS